MHRIALLLSMLVLFSCASRNAKEQQPFKVHTYTVTKGATSRSLSFPGRVKASEEISLAFKVSGKIQNIYAKEGSFVKKGTLLAEIDSVDYKNLLSAADAKFNQVSSEAGRVIRLYGDSVVSANDYDKARYGLQQAEAALVYAKRQVEDCKLYAPLDGYVEKRIFEPSSIVASGLPVIRMVSAGVPEIYIDIPASVYMGISRFRNCTAHFTNDIVQPLQLEIDNVQPKANANQLYTMTFSITSRGETMPKPGMAAMVDVEYVLDDNTNTDTYVPSGALFEKDGQSFVWVVDETGSVRSRKVDVKSLDSNGMATIEGLLESGTVVVTAGVHKLREGEKVVPMEKPSDTNVGGIL